MKIQNFDYDLEHGFAWVTIEGNTNENQFTVQCCLVAEREEDGTLIEHKKEIVKHDCGHNWGICGEVNAPAFEYWGGNRCMKNLFFAAREAGFKVE